MNPYTPSTPLPGDTEILRQHSFTAWLPLGMASVLPSTLSARSRLIRSVSPTQK